MPTPIGFFSTNYWFGSPDAGFFSDSDADVVGGGFGGFLVPQMLLLTGITPVFVAAAASGNFLFNNGHVMLHYRNANATARTCAVQDPTSSLEGATAFDPDVTFTVPGNGEKVVGPYPTARFSGVLVVLYSGVTGLTVCATATG